MGMLLVSPNIFTETDINVIYIAGHCHSMAS